MLFSVLSQSVMRCWLCHLRLLVSNVTSFRSMLVWMGVGVCSNRVVYLLCRNFWGVISKAIGFSVISFFKFRSKVIDSFLSIRRPYKMREASGCDSLSRLLLSAIDVFFIFSTNTLNETRLVINSIVVVVSIVVSMKIKAVRRELVLEGQCLL